MSQSHKSYEYPPPIAAGAEISYTEAKGLSNRVDPFDDSPNAKFNIPQTGSIYYAGKIFYKIGAFSQITWEGVDNSVHLDHTDIRFASDAMIGNKSLVYGFTLNNNPTVQDVFNTTPAFSFPYTSSAVANTPAASTIIDNRLALQVGGLGAYAIWNDLIYAEIAVYRTNRKGITRPLAAGVSIDTVVDSYAPYWRLALQQQWKEHFFSLGTYGIVANTFPGGESSGPTDKFTDTAFDAHYQYIGKKHILSVQATWIYEKQDRDASFSLGMAANQSDTLDTFRINLNYWNRTGFGTLGGTASYFSTTGDTDTSLYSSAPVTGSVTGSPDSRGYILEADYLPKDWLKVSLQYTIYEKFNGSSSNYDGFGRSAFDNNTFYFLLWFLI